ncbi:restriction endonuclease subunit S [Parasutterella sp.]|uniref:restriction endonuclease subunit S n=1 Tax=Parasutterella sp. TaxID=2049037 RepID=UPI00351FCFB8
MTRNDVQKFLQIKHAWEQRELKDVAEIVGGGTPSTSVPAYWNGSIDWYSPTEIGQENFAKGSKRKISNEGLNNSSAKLLPAHKTILFTSRATIGEAAILEREGATNQGFQSIVTKEGVDVYFLYSYKHHLKKQALIKASGSTFLEISKNEVEGLHVPVPSGEEQAKIGSFFKLVDKAITLHQRKLEALKKLKRTLLQKMFPKKGHLKPELRFFGFTNDWEQRKLGELAATFGYGLNAAAKSFDGRHKYIRITDIDESTRRFLCSSLTSPDIDFEEAAPYRLAEGDVLFARTGASVGKSYRYVRTDGEVYFAGFLIRFRFKDKEAAEFVFQNSLTAKFQNFIKTSSQRSGQPGINAQQFSGYQIAVPNSEERERIGSFFSRLDTAITLHQRKLEIYKKLKKGLLQKMFI